ncbi:HD-GYP domain-containing protein [Pseudothauera lacus]|uniref:Phosphohydrolase n=1 Tax=Pseudothauera lacus TaxID=2136175 RepID=A0A2T4IF67_9RHOO|nr:HD-GYP domain-containing protein [Pseudothauera lacus]PTD96408.1 phosphohydrolase [Pseudothauera lacus]
MDKLAVDRLQPGIFISLTAVGWVRHPFMLNEFRLSSQRQIDALREMGLRDVAWDPARSTATPLPERAAEDSADDEEIDFGGSALAGMLDDKRHRLAQLRQQRERLARRERQYEQDAVVASEILKGFPGRASDAHAKSRQLSGQVVDSLIGQENVLIHLVNQKSREAGPTFHALNVMMLALLLGRALGLPEDEMRHLGAGALLHDVGKAEIPPRILRAATRTPPEEEFYRAHIGYGIKAVAGARAMQIAERNIIACHHERWDGSGFPNKLAGEKIPRLARIVAIANRYDNLCNPFDLKLAMTPAEAVRHLFKSEGAHFDPALLQAFVKTLGVYPPGSFVLLSNGAVGLVVETRHEALLQPLVMLYDRDIPRNEAMLLDLRDVDLKIESAANPAKLPAEVVEYLAPRGRLDYYVEGAAR